MPSQNVQPQTLPPPPDPLGIDIMFTPEGDIAINPWGDIALVSGPDNAIQALLLRIRSSPGDLPLHPGYGSQFNEAGVGMKWNPDAVFGLATSELAQIISSDRRFIGVGNLQVTPIETATGLATSVSCDLYLTNGVTVGVANLSEPRISGISDPSYGDVSPYTVDPLDYTTIGSAEFDTLADIDEQQALLNDTN